MCGTIMVRATAAIWLISEPSIITVPLATFWPGCLSTGRHKPFLFNIYPFLLLRLLPKSLVRVKRKNPGKTNISELIQNTIHRIKADVRQFVEEQLDYMIKSPELAKLIENKRLPQNQIRPLRG
jgi:hypothetical protein